MIDPLPHSTISEALALGVPEDFKQEKVYLPQWLHTKSMVEIIEKDLAEIKAELTVYIAEQTGTSTPEGGESSSEPTIEGDNAKLEAQAALKGSVGGVQGILSIQAAVKSGATSSVAATTTLREIYGFKPNVITELLT